MKKNCGIAIIEVKDWNLEIYSIIDSKTWLCRLPNDNSKPVESPFAQISRYKDSLYKTESRILFRQYKENKKAYGLVKTLIFWYGPTSEEAAYFLQDIDNKFIPVFTLEDLEEGQLESYLWKNFVTRRSPFFSDKLYFELQRILKPSEYNSSKMNAIKFSEDQARLSISKAGSYKIRGGAGSGKTTVLIYRAINAFYRTHSPILILTYNITLKNYIRDCITSILGSFQSDFFTIENYHQFKYHPSRSSYKVILVDEVQDFKNKHIDEIYRYLEENGEIVFFADEQQNIYERTLIDEDGRKRVYTKVPGRWNELHGTYRLTKEISELAQNFQREFFAECDDLETQNVTSGGILDYYQAENLNEVYVIFQNLLEKNMIHSDDVVILANEIDMLRLLEMTLNSHGFETLTTFETQEEFEYFSRHNLDDDLKYFRRIAKNKFRMESGKIKISTVHSYKGWSIHTEIFRIRI